MVSAEKVPGSLDFCHHRGMDFTSSSTVCKSDDLTGAPNDLTAQLKSPFGDSCFTSLCGGFFPDRAKVSATLAPEVLSQST